MKTTKRVLLNEAHYHELNKQISDAFGFDENEATQIYANPEPEMVGEYYEMIITAEVQEQFPELLEGLELF